MPAADTKNVRMELKGFKELSDKMGQIADEVRKQLKDDIQHFCLQAVNDAKKNAPADMGILRNSIQFYFLSGTGIVGEVATTCGYGAFVEFGTGPLGRSTWKGELPEGYVHGSGGKMPPLDPIRDWCRRHKIPEKAAYVIARKIGKNGLKARPYFTPAWDKAKRDFSQELENIESIIRNVK